MADGFVAGRASRNGVGAGLYQSQRDVLAWLTASAAMMLALMLPALWNGFPLIFPDTGGYLMRPMQGTLGMGRSAFYGLFLDGGIAWSFWPNAVAQCALIVWLIVLTLRAHGLGGRPWLALGIAAMLTVGTSLPWFAGQLMPDILFPAAVLALHLLAFRAEQLTRAERWCLAAVIVFAIPSHMAAAGLCAGMIVALWLLARIPELALPRPRLTFAAAAVAAGIVLSPVSNYAMTGVFGFTPGGSSFLFGRLIEDGMVARYLDERCPDPSLRICAYKAQVPNDADTWLWGDNTPFYKLGGWEGFGGEEKEIILDTLSRYPVTHAVTAIVATVKQFFTFKTELSVWHNAPTIETFRAHVPQLMPQVLQSRQETDHFDVGPLNYLHVPLAGLAIAALCAALLWRRRLDVTPPLAALCVSILLALAVNAAVCGIFSHPVDRYQGRLVLLAPFAVAILIARRRQRPTLGRPAI
jgi:hypothetical protein